MTLLLPTTAPLLDIPFFFDINSQKSRLGNLVLADWSMQSKELVAGQKRLRQFYFDQHYQSKMLESRYNLSD